MTPDVKKLLICTGAQSNKGLAKLADISFPEGLGRQGSSISLRYKGSQKRLYEPYEGPWNNGTRARDPTIGDPSARDPRIPDWQGGQNRFEPSMHACKGHWLATARGSVMPPQAAEGISETAVQTRNHNLLTA